MQFDSAEVAPFDLDSGWLYINWYTPELFDDGIPEAMAPTKASLKLSLYSAGNGPCLTLCLNSDPSRLDARGGGTVSIEDRSRSRRLRSSSWAACWSPAMPCGNAATTDRR